jgi:hypothetical protein
MARTIPGSGWNRLQLPYQQEIKAMAKFGPKPKSLAERLWANVAIRGDDECWEWFAHTDKDGYGDIGIPVPGSKYYKPIRVHRASWELHFGPIPEGMKVLHKCDNPPCCNPKHLLLGSTQDNVKDRCSKGRSVKGESVWCAKINAEQVREIRRRAALGENQHDLAKEFNTTQANISCIFCGKTWKHVQ